MNDRVKCLSRRWGMWMILIAAVGMILILPQTARGDDSRTIRVGYTDQARVMQHENGTYSGYVTDYLNEISEYTGWEFEYVPETMSNIMEMLKNGELDLLGMMPRSEEKEGQYLYSEMPMSYNYTTLYTSMDRDICYGEYEKIDGCAVGISEGCAYGEAFVKYAQENSISCEIKTYPSLGDNLDALSKDEVQFAAVGNITAPSDLKVVGQFSAQPTYFMTGVQNDSLMKELDAAMNQMKIDEPDLEAKLAAAYDTAANVDLRFTREEQEYINSAGTINVRIFPNKRPIVYYEGEDVKGTLPDYLDMLGELTGLKFRCIQAETDSAMKETSLLGEDGSLLLSSNTAIAAQTDLIQSSSIMQLDLAYVKRIKDDADFNPSTFAVLENMAFLKRLFPEEYTIRTYDTVDECMEAVMRGEADMTIQYELVVTHLLQKPKYASNLVEWIGSDYAVDTYLYGTKDQDILFSILEKTQRYLSDTQRSEIVSSSLLNHTYENQFLDVLYQYNWAILFGAMVLVVLILTHLLRRRTQNAERQARENEELQRRVWTDNLTGLYNRDGFFANAREMLSHLDGEAAIVRINICRFKQFNELYGLENGDMILRYVGSQLKIMENCAPMVLGRFAADQFFLCVASRDIEKLSFVRQMDIASLSLDINLTYGIYIGSRDMGYELNIMCDRADMAKSSAQPTEENYIHYYSEADNEKLRYEQMLEHDMERALRENQFIIYIQPKYDVATEVIVGGEVLVRWLHPEQGLIPPGKFIELFERNGFIRDLDYCVWEKCCQYIADMKQDGIPMIPISINMSRIHFYGFDSILRLSELLEIYDLDSKDIELEITESMCAENVDMLLDKCRQLRSMGFRIAMDDFGSGYSSLSSLKDMPVDILKMDLRFLAGDDVSDQTDRGHNILRSTIMMAHTIGLDVVVEGLETREQRDFIREIGNCAAQGYYYAKPMSTDDFTELIKSSNVGAVVMPTSGMAANLRRERLRRERLQPMLELISVSENAFGYLLPEGEGILSCQLAQEFNCSERIPNFAERVLNAQSVAPGSELQWQSLIHAMERGERSGSAIVECRVSTGGTEMLWFRFDTVVDHEGNPLIAMFVISDFSNISAQVDDLIASMQTQAEIENRRLQENEQLLSIITQHSDRVVCYYDVQKRQSRVWNSDICRKCQLPRLCETTVESILENEAFMPEGKDAIRQMFTDIDRGVSSGNTKVRVYSENGELHWYDLMFTTICDDKGTPVSALISHKDVTKQYEHEMAYLRQFQSLSETEFSLGLMEVDLTADRIELQDSLFAPMERSAVGGSMAAFTEQMIPLKMQEEHWEEAREFFSRDHMLHQHDVGNRLLSRTWPMTFLSGKQGWVRFDVELIADIYTGHIRAYFRLWDVTTIREKQLEIQRRSEQDGMTGLYNRSTTEELIQEKLKTDFALGIFVILDMDRLKQINDGYGHSEGDRAIVNVAKVMKSHFRGSDILGRIGGDEFVIYMSGAAKNKDVIAGTLVELMRKLGSLSVGEQEDMGVTCSIGCVVAQRDSTYESLYRQADKALYHVKKSGRNNFAFYSPEMEDESFVYAMDKLFTLDHAKHSESSDVKYLISALSDYYHLVLSCNVTENSYHVLQEVKDGIFAMMPTFGKMDTMVNLSMMRMKPDDAERFDNAVSRHALLRADEQGLKHVEIYFDFQDFDGLYKPAECTSILYHNEKGDVCEFAMIRWRR